MAGRMRLPPPRFNTDASRIEALARQFVVTLSLVAALGAAVWFGHWLIVPVLCALLIFWGSYEKFDEIEVFQLLKARRNADNYQRNEPQTTVKHESAPQSMKPFRK